MNCVSYYVGQYVIYCLQDTCVTLVELCLGAQTSDPFDIQRTVHRDIFL